MNITEAFVKTAFIQSSDLRAKTITLLVSGELDICDNCGFTMTPNTVCEVCENEWADQMAAREDELNWGRASMQADLDRMDAVADDWAYEQSCR